MPHCILEYSNNLVEENDNHTRETLAQIHQVVMSSGLFKANDIKVRSQQYDIYHIGNAKPQNAFIHLKIQILSGRELAARKALCSDVTKYLRERYKNSVNELDCDITVEVSEIERETYSKTLHQ